VLKQKFLILFGSNIVLSIIGFSAGIVVARVAGPEVVGTIAFGTAYVGLWAFVGGLFGSGHIKLISEGQDIGKCMSVAYRTFIAGTIIYLMVVVSFFLIQKYIFNVEFESSTQQVVIFILLFANIFTKYYNLSSITFTATMEQVRANLPHFTKSVIYHFGRIVVVLLGFKALGLATWNLVITVLMLPLVYRLLSKYPGTGWDKNLFKRYVGYAVPSLLLVIIHSIIAHADKLFLAHFTNTTELGYYSAAYALGGLIMVASMSIGNIFFPLFSGLIAKNDWPAVGNKIKQYQEFLSLFILPFVCAIVIVTGPLILTVLGSKYEPSIEPFMIIALATYVEVVGMPYGNIITGAGRFYLLVLINIIVLVVFVFSITLFLSPNFLGLGAIGLALHLLVMKLATNLLYLHISKRLSGLSFFIPGNIIRYILTISIALLFYMHLEFFLDMGSYGWVIIIPVYIGGVYFVMFIFRLITIGHFKQLADLIDLRKIVNYAKSELRSDSHRNE
jgi:O-antigen/teichoic acid export membrane protein